MTVAIKNFLLSILQIPRFICLYSRILLILIQHTILHVLLHIMVVLAGLHQLNLTKLATVTQPLPLLKSVLLNLWIFLTMRGVHSTHMNLSCTLLRVITKFQVFITNYCDFQSNAFFKSNGHQNKNSVILRKTYSHLVHGKMTIKSSKQILKLTKNWVRYSPKTTKIGESF